MKNIKLNLLIILMTLVSITSCKKDDTPNPIPNPTVVKKYSGSGSAGDLITFDINHSDKTYSVNNETTNQSENGSYSTMTDPDLNGIYQVSTGSDNFYAVELDDKLIAANFPTGNPLNTISFGVSSTLDNTDNTNQIVGDYVFMVMDNDGIMNDPTIKEWGVLNISNDNTWKMKQFATNTGNGSVTEMSPDLYSGLLNITSPDFAGTWNLNGIHKERLDIKVNGESSTLSGYAYASQQEAAFLLDLGTGSGFLLGIKITNNETINTLTGNYKFINVWDKGRGAGNYSINNMGKVDWKHKGTDGTSTGTFQLTACNNVLKNVFYAKSVQLEPNYYEDIYCVIIGDIIMHFSFDDSNGDFAQYGVGARIN